ncbi:GMP synthase - Glutamine amidotransferase domain [Candidatus Paraburkholderia calva]|nr:GMP synthase - Glutamine amidotransferase domain [Candidatus Paraburkholderia calva]
MKKEVLAIRHVHFKDLGCLELVFSERGNLVCYLDVGRGRIDAPNPLDPSLLVVLGGSIGTYDDANYPHLAPLLSMLEKRIVAGLPTIGICLGSQLIARALGVRVYPSDTLELGWKLFELTEAGRASALRHLEVDGAPVPVFHWHGDTFDLPDGATLLASTDVCAHQAFTWGEHVLALQCHPEVLTDRFENWLITYPSEIASSGTTAAALREDTRATVPRSNTRPARCSTNSSTASAFRSPEPRRQRAFPTFHAPCVIKTGMLCSTAYSFATSPRHERAVYFHDVTQPADPQSHFHITDVSVFRRARRGDRLAHDPSGQPRAVRRGHAVHRGDGRGSRTAASRRPTSVCGTT